MKSTMLSLSVLMLVHAVTASESALTTTYQPLNGLGAGGVHVIQVTCHHWYANSASSAIDLIHRRNVPPTDNPERATADLNLASVCGLRFSTNDLGAVGSEPWIVLDATRFDGSKVDVSLKEDVIRASLECLRRCLPDRLMATKVTLKCQDRDKEWMSKIVAEFDAAPRDKPFYVAK